MTHKPSKTIEAMTGQEVIAACQADSPLARVRRAFRDGHAEMYLASQQRVPPTLLECHRMELQVANRICALFGIELP